MMSTQSSASAELETVKKTTMKAAVLAAPQTVQIQEAVLPEPGPNQVRIRVEGCGVCASNIPVWEGREWFNYPLAAGNPGHEGWGTLDAIGDNVTGLEPGDRVAALSYNSYAEYDLAEASQVVKLPDSLAGTPFPGEPLGCALNIFNRSDIRPGQTVAILGMGCTSSKQSGLLGPTFNVGFGLF